MKISRYIFFFAVLFLASCNRNNSKSQFIVPDKNDINDIVKTIIIQDSLAYDSIPLSIDLRKIKIFAPNFYKNLPPPPDISKVNIGNLINSIHSRPYYFEKSDSLYIIFQSDTLNSFKVDNSMSRLIKFTDTSVQYQNRGADKYSDARFLELSIPIFSLDQKKAYVELDKHCPRCGSGFAFYMKKEMGRWKIKQKTLRWIN